MGLVEGMGDCARLGGLAEPLPLSAQLDGWIHEKMLMARDGTREDGHKLHKRWLRHQAFMAELAQNKEWLEKIERVRMQKAPLLMPGARGLQEPTSHFLHHQPAVLISLNWFRSFPCLFLALCPRAIHVTSLSLSLPVCEMVNIFLDDCFTPSYNLPHQASFHTIWSI